MARRRRCAAPSVSLFPFLSILACVIGTLTLMIAGLTFGQMGAEEEPGVIYASLSDEIEAGEQEASELEKLIGQAEAIRRFLADARAELVRLRKKEGAVSDEERAALALVRQVTPRRREKKDLEDQKRKLKKEIEDLKRRIREKGQGPHILVRPVRPTDGSKTDRVPRFVECTRDELIFHPGGERIAKASMATSRAFSHLLTQVRLSRNEALVFLIRPNGVKTFDAARKLVWKRRVRHGYLPLPGYGRVDLRLFK